MQRNNETPPVALSPQLGRRDRLHQRAASASNLKAMKANKIIPHDAAGLTQAAADRLQGGAPQVPDPAWHARDRYRTRTLAGGAHATRQHHSRALRHLRDKALYRSGRAVPLADAGGGLGAGLDEAVALLLRTREHLLAEFTQMDRQLKAIRTALPVCQALSIPSVGV
jgi:hypothetical protein